MSWKRRAPVRSLRLCGEGLVVLALAGCAGLVDKPVQRTQYDFGPVTPAAAAPAQAARGAPTQPAIVLPEIDAAGSLEGFSVLYRLAYADANQLKPYAQARWTAPPPQLVRQRLREVLGRERMVLNLSEATALAREGGAMPNVLRIELEEFSQLFDAPAQSHGLLRLRATLLGNTAAGERLLGQRSFIVQAPAPTPDAPGGVRALAAATDEAAAQIAQWLAQVR